MLRSAVSHIPLRAREVNGAELKRAISQQKPKVNIFLVDTEDIKYLLLNLDGADYGESFMINYFIV